MTYALPIPGEVIAERYRLKRAIARGSMGVIMQAEHLSLQRDVAIKFLAPGTRGMDIAVGRFRREAMLSKELNHPNIIQIYDFGQHHDAYYLVMELLDGHEVRDLIARGPQPFTRVVDIAVQALEGLAEAHSKGIVHRDLKPANLFLTRDRRDRDVVKLLDFGIAKAVNDPADDVHLTQAGRVCGTPAYMAPEVYLDEAVTPAIDVYAMGLIMLELLYGRRIVEHRMPAVMMLKHLRMPFYLVDGVKQSPLGAVLEKALHKEPSQRFAHADAFLGALLEVAKSVPETTLSRFDIDREFDRMIADFKADPNVSKTLRDLGEDALDESADLDLGEDWEPYEPESEPADKARTESDIRRATHVLSQTYFPDSTSGTWQRVGERSGTSESLSAVPSANVDPIEESKADILVGVAAALVIIVVIMVLYVF